MTFSKRMHYCLFNADLESPSLGLAFKPEIVLIMYSFHGSRKLN